MRNFIKAWFANLSRTEIALQQVNELRADLNILQKKITTLEESNKMSQEEVMKVWDFIRAIIDYLNVNIDREREPMNRFNPAQFSRDIIVLTKKK